MKEEVVDDGHLGADQLGRRQGEVLAVIDADLQHPPEVVERLWAEIAKGADLAAASRRAEGSGVNDWSVIRRALSRGAQLLGLFMLPGVVGRVSDPMSGYFMVRRRAIEGTALSPLGYKILIEVIARGRIRRVAEVGYVFRERAAGESKVTARLYLDQLVAPGLLHPPRGVTNVTGHRSRCFRHACDDSHGAAGRQPGKRQTRS